MADNVSLSSEEKELLRSVIRKRQPSMLWIMGSDQPLSASQRDTIKGMVMDEMRESGGPTSERGGALKKLIDRLAQL
jgi:hypothetical protein